MSDILANLQAVRARIAAAQQTCGRTSESVSLVAVSKTFDATAVREAVAAGQRSFGENYVQEGIGKIEALADLRSQIEWHFIGPMQSNKTRQIAEHFDWVHSIDRLKIAQRLSEQRPPALRPLQVCLQVNISGEASKSGVAPGDTLELARAVHALPHLQLRGLMAVPAPSDNAIEQRGAFAALRTLNDSLRENGLPVDTLSMGMSSDLESAIAEGATIVRIGTAVFGTRPRAAH